MPLYVKETAGKEFEKVPQGVHLAVCNMVVDVGMQENSRGKQQHKVVIRWEIPGTKVEWKDKEGNSHSGPLSILNFYTASLSDRAFLRRDLENWRGKAFTEAELQKFDLFNVLGAACQIQVTHNAVGNKTYANVTGIMGVPKGVQRPTATQPLLKYSADERGQWEQLPGWLQEIISKGVPAQTQQPQAPSEPEFDDDIPF